MTVRTDALGGTDFTNGEVLFAEDQNDTFNKLTAYNSLAISGLNLIRTIIDRTVVYSIGEYDIYGDAYIGVTGRANTNSNCTFSSNKFISTDRATTEPYILIEATSVDTTAFATRNCVAGKYAAGSWIVRCTTGTDEAKRAALLTVMFYDYILRDNCTGITAVRTNVARDVGKRGVIGSGLMSDTTGTMTGTFEDTSTNADCSAWFLVNDGSQRTRFEMPEGTTLYDGGSGAFDNIGTDTSANEKTNPANFQMEGYQDDGSVNTSPKCFVLCSGSVAWAQTGDFVINGTEDSFIDDSIPELTTAVETFENYISTPIPSGTFSSTFDNAFGVAFIDGFEAGADIQYKFINATEDTGWLECGSGPVITSVTAFTAEPTDCIIKLIPKTSPATGSPSIKGFAFRAFSI